MKSARVFSFDVGGIAVLPTFGAGITSGAIALPASPVSAACRCLEAYHAWFNSANIGTVTFPVAGTYLMTPTLNAGTYNPLFFTFTKM